MSVSRDVGGVIQADGALIKPSCKTQGSASLIRVHFAFKRRPIWTSMPLAQLSPQSSASPYLDRMALNR